MGKKYESEDGFDYEYEDVRQSRQVYSREPRRKKGGLWYVLGILTGLIGSLVIGGVIMALGGSSPSPAGSGASAQKDRGKTLDAGTLEKLELLEHYIDTYYLESDSLTAQQKRDGLYKGLFAALGDPYSVYYTAEEMEQLEEDTQGIYYGIGAYIGTDEVTGAPMIAGVIKNSPAEAADLHDGDILYQVDGEDVTSFSLDEVVRRVRGPEGTQVHLTLYRDGELVEVDITRAKVNSPTIEWELLSDKISGKDSLRNDQTFMELAKHVGYLQITEFDDITVGQFRTAMEELRGSKGITSLILDLRNNPGGNVSSVTQIAEELLPEGLVFYMEDREGRRTEYKCKGADFDLPMVVLVNGNSASAAEILAGAIQDAKIGTIMGTQTFGKGIVQNVVPLNDGTGFKLTTAGYYTRGGQDIHKVGITPDQVVEYDADVYKEIERDNQVIEAADFLLDEISID